MNFESPDSSLIAGESFSEIGIEEEITPETPVESVDLESNASDLILIDEDDLPRMSTTKIPLSNSNPLFAKNQVDQHDYDDPFASVFDQF
jgi:hypothetical protein